MDLNIKDLDQSKMVEQGINLDMAIIYKFILAKVKLDTNLYFIDESIITKELPILMKGVEQIAKDLKQVKKVYFEKADEKEVVSFLKTLYCSKMGIHKCEWCESRTFILNKHHFPIPKSLGGNETVNICTECHYIFHSNKIYKLKK